MSEGIFACDTTGMVGRKRDSNCFASGECRRTGYHGALNAASVISGKAPGPEKIRSQGFVFQNGSGAWEMRLKNVRNIRLLGCVQIVGRPADLEAVVSALEAAARRSAIMKRFRKI